MKTKNLGWMVAGGLALGMAGMVGSGFQGPTQKIGTVNMARVFNDSEFVKKQDGDLKALASSRQSVAEFIEAYRMMPTADLQKFKDLSVKDKPSDGDKAEIERIRNAAVQADQKYRDLQTKANKTPDETTQFNEFNRRVQENTTLLQRVQDEMGRELQDRQGKLQEEAMTRAKAAISEVSKKEGYTVVFADQYAPYSANDVTEEALKAMNAKR